MRLIPSIITIGVLSVVTFGQTAPARKQHSNSKNRIVFAGESIVSPKISRIAPVSLPDGRMAVVAGDTIYMAGVDGKILWSYSLRAPITAKPALRLDQNEIAVIGYDLTFVRLDASTGKLVWKADMNGRAVFSNIQPYGQGYLVVLDMSGYRDNLLHYNDQVEFWGDKDDDSWSLDFPIGASLTVVGDKIYAVQYEKKAVALTEIKPPKHS
ncbi:MAG: PQQ-like domain [Candidatus Angelobacter sp.]|jgi:hypothetical protein|nr:PQQ-like domain [Candidatus Angelobacter sp.]